MINIKDEEKLQILVDNQSELNYRELTNFLELPYLIEGILKISN